MPFKKKKGTVSPVNILREYVSTYMYWVKTVLGQNGKGKIPA